MTTTELDLTEYPESDGKPMTESDPTRDYLTYSVEALTIYFQSRRNVYVSGNIFVYYRKGDNKAVVSPDVLVVFGVPKRKRRSYQVWKEGSKVPSFILEITSKTTKNEDEFEKPKLYAQLGVQEYFQYDPTADYLNPQLKGSRLVDGQYQPIVPETYANGLITLHSQVLGLELRLQEPFPAFVDLESVNLAAKPMRFYDPQTGETLLNYKELEEARVAEAQARSLAEEAQAAAEQARLVEAEARSQAEQARLAAIPRLLQMGLTEAQIAEALNLSVDEVRQGRL